MACVSVTTSWVDDVISPDSATWPLLWDNECFAKDVGHERFYGGLSLRELGKKSCRYASLSADDGPIIISNNEKDSIARIQALEICSKNQALGAAVSRCWAWIVLAKRLSLTASTSWPIRSVSLAATLTSPRFGATLDRFLAGLGKV